MKKSEKEGVVATLVVAISRRYASSGYNDRGLIRDIGEVVLDPLKTGANSRVQKAVHKSRGIKTP